MANQIIIEAISEALKNLDSEAEQVGTAEAGAVAEAAKAVVFSLLYLGDRLNELTAEVHTLNARLVELTGEVPGNRKALRVYDWANKG